MRWNKQFAKAPAATSAASGASEVCGKAASAASDGSEATGEALEVFRSLLFVSWNSYILL